MGLEGMCFERQGGLLPIPLLSLHRNNSMHALAGRERLHLLLKSVDLIVVTALSTYKFIPRITYLSPA